MPLWRCSTFPSVCAPKTMASPFTCYFATRRSRCAQTRFDRSTLLSWREFWRRWSYPTSPFFTKRSSNTEHKIAFSQQVCLVCAIQASTRSFFRKRNYSVSVAAILARKAVDLWGAPTGLRASTRHCEVQRAAKRADQTALREGDQGRALAIQF